MAIMIGQELSGPLKPQVNTKNESYASKYI